MTQQQRYISFDTAVQQPVQYYLSASYLYYIRGESLMMDPDFDHLCQHILENWDTIEHSDKYVINRDDLSAGTGCSIREADYPLRVQSASWRLLGTLMDDDTNDT